MELRHLKYFIAVATELHFGRAAAKLSIAQPPLSQQIRKLEDELGTMLLQRTKRRVRLTQAGRTFLHEAQAIVAHAEDAVAKTRRADRGDTGRLSIGWPPWSNWTDLPRRLGSFCERNPDVHLDIHNLNTADQLSSLHSGQIDIEFFLRPFGSKEPLPFESGAVKTEVVLSHLLIAVLPKTHKLSSAKRIQFKQFAAEPYISFKRESAAVFYDSVADLYHRQGFSLNVRHETDHPSTVLGLVTAGLGVTLLPLSGIHMIAGIVFRPIVPALPMVQVALGWRAENESPLMAKFIETIHK
ncbi:MAG TPA: LysR substrate-binding domain-containing protein [Candidatus Binatia bacterium]